MASQPLPVRISLARLKAILLASNTILSPQLKIWEARLKTIEGFNQTPPIKQKIKDQFAIAISDLLATRLYANDRSVPLLSEADLPLILCFIKSTNEKSKPAEKSTARNRDEQIIEAITASFRSDTEASEEKLVENVFKASLSAYLKGYRKPVLKSGDVYDESWAWIKSVLKIMRQNNIPVEAVLGSQEYRDAVTREVFNKSEYIAYCNRQYRNLFTTESWLTKELLDEVGFGSPPTDKLERQIFDLILDSFVKTVIAPKIQPLIDVTNTWIDEQVQRIYGASA